MLLHLIFGGRVEEVRDQLEACLRGELPPRMPLAFQIPTVADPTLAPEGYHIASAYGFSRIDAKTEDDEGDRRSHVFVIGGSRENHS